MIFKIIDAKNGSTPNEEIIYLQASTEFNTKGYAVVDRTFDAEGKISNEFRHIYVFPEINLKKGQKIYLRSGKGEDGEFTFNNSSEKYYRLYWGADSCIWNDKGRDTATLISFLPVNSFPVPAV